MDILGVTILFVAVSTIISCTLKFIRKDKCLKDFNDFNISVIKNNGEMYYGKMKLEATGMELLYKKPYPLEDKKVESSYIIYKKEYPEIKIIARLHHDLTPEGKKKRRKELKKSYHPNFIRRSVRKICNFCKTIKEAISEVLGLLITRFTRSSSKNIQAQSSQISKIKKDILGYSASFEPLLENHIGNIVILEMQEGEKEIRHHGVLKEYTSDFCEIMDVKFSYESKIEKADLIIPRKTSIVRHLGE